MYPQVPPVSGCNLETAIMNVLPQATLRLASRLPGVARSALVLALAISSPIRAQALLEPPGSNATTNDPYAVSSLTDMPIAQDPGFNSGFYFGDAFSNTDSNYIRGRKIARLANGDVVVAGLVAHIGAVNTAGNNLGLVRYNSAGQRVPWANPGASGHYNNEYIVIPNQATAGYTEIVDILATGAPQNRILVLINLTDSQGGRSVMLRSFDYNGTAHAPLFNVLTTGGQHSTGAGLVYYREGEDYKVAVIGTRFDTTKGRIVYRRFRVVPGFADETGVRDVHTTVGPCSTSIQTGGCIATAVTSVGWSAGAWLPPRIYVAGVTTHNSDPNANDFFVTRLVGGDNTGVGYADGSFGSGGTQRVWFDAGGNNRDYATAVVAIGGPDGLNSTDLVYVVGQVAQTCSPGIGIAAFNHNGTPAAAFGTGGKLRFGGTDIACSGSLLKPGHFAHAAVQTLGRSLVIAGMATRRPICVPPGGCEDEVDPMLAVVRMSDGAVQELRNFPVQPGNRVRHGAFYGIVASGTGMFTATGDDRYFATHPNFPGRQEVVTGRFKLDRIFGNGYQ